MNIYDKASQPITVCIEFTLMLSATDWNGIVCLPQTSHPDVETVMSVGSIVSARSVRPHQ